MTGLNSNAIFLLGVVRVLVLLEDASPYPMGHGWIQGSNEGRLSARFVFAAADNAGGFQIKLGEIGAGFPTAGSELDGAFELDANFFGEASGAQKPCTIRFLAVDASQPELVDTIAGGWREG